MSFHITRVTPVQDDAMSEPLWQATCVREDCPWTSDLWATQLGAEEAGWSHESNGDRFTGENEAINEKADGQ